MNIVLLISLRVFYRTAVPARQRPHLRLAGDGLGSGLRDCELVIKRCKAVRMRSMVAFPVRDAPDPGFALAPCGWSSHRRAVQETA